MSERPPLAVLDLREVHHAHAVRTENPHAGLAREVTDSLLHAAPLVPGLREAGAEHHRGADPVRRARFERRNDGPRGQAHDRLIDLSRQVFDRGHGLQALHLARPRIDRMDRAAKVRLEVTDGAARDFRGIGRRSDYGDRARPEQGIERVEVQVRSFEAQARLANAGFPPARCPR